MKISLDVDPSRWLHLPRFEEDSAEARQWEDTVIQGMKTAWHGTLDAQGELVVREALRHGLRQVSEDDAVTLQYWPDTSIINAIVHVAASPFEPGDDRNVSPLIDIPYVSQPVTSVFESDGLGAGFEVRYLTTVGGDSNVRAGGVNYLFQNDFGFVAVGVTPTLPGLIGIMLEPLREVVRSIRVVDDAEGNWHRASVDASRVEPRGEDWLVDIDGQNSALAEGTL